MKRKCKWPILPSNSKALKNTAMLLRDVVVPVMTFLSTFVHFDSSRMAFSILAVRLLSEAMNFERVSGFVTFVMISSSSISPSSAFD